MRELQELQRKATLKKCLIVHQEGVLRDLSYFLPTVSKMETIDSRAVPVMETWL